MRGPNATLMTDRPDAWCLDCDVPVWEHRGDWRDETGQYHDRHEVGAPPVGRPMTAPDTAPSSTTTRDDDTAGTVHAFPWCHVAYVRLGGRVSLIRQCQCDRHRGRATGSIWGHEGPENGLHDGRRN